MKAQHNISTRAGLLGLIGVVFLLWILCGSAAQAQTPAATPAVPAAEYRLGSGDAVRISVYQSPDLTLDARIGEAGLVSYPLLGNVKIGGMTVSAAEKLIADAV